ncbi:TetR/AcrR family transcriptional regulator [Streptomonospora nanhaiensis]|uniref:AcrR family transcriptional regulator n=1 Tax=Streptomonospora nanhaiensis TaxID=1323731 RepID=A0A853BSE0_9ACTN|nr:TetR/AcrR family transcriptional regulator [Streptomonospora nanhaiensis]MBV2365151.1 TetR/AcrR family transcriptional regulator [Streptomonospora nanhaiensis]MBV2366344.1 TetR/AcrR family transcriptional regulator [Streptomonospora nanhaiensis]MBX9391953.1 TetR/AcrR family transcriptional regulator [Streptomonospora nanhaiensis]NYI97421.1 AcrR family transcriptional regulator [Streptomonospora nanhaiensis]
MGQPTTGGGEAGGTGRGAAPDRGAVVAAALRLFTEAGYESTTMDDIAAAAGTSRRSLFRHFGSKEDILFAELDDLFETVQRYLDAAPGDDPVATVRTAARMVFQRYAGDPAVTVPRFRLVRAVPRLRDREIAMTARYQRAFSRYLRGGAGTGPRALAAEALAASVIAAHNHVLRSWLRSPEDPVPWAGFDEAMDFVTESLGALLRAPEEGARPAGESQAVLVAVYPARTPGADVLDRVRAALEPNGPL